MKHGTYHEALQAGFNEEQAAFFSRMCIDTRGETMNEVLKHLEAEKKLKSTSQSLKTELSIIFIGGMIIGVIISSLLF